MPTRTLTEDIRQTQAYQYGLEKGIVEALAAWLEMHSLLDDALSRMGPTVDAIVRERLHDRQTRVDGAPS